MLLSRRSPRRAVPPDHSPDNVRRRRNESWRERNYPISKIAFIVGERERVYIFDRCRKILKRNVAVERKKIVAQSAFYSINLYYFSRKNYYK